METSSVSRSAQILRWSLIIGIVIVLNLFYNYTLSLVFSAPDYNTFCPQKQINITPDTQEKCITEGGAWTQYPVDANPKMIEAGKITVPNTNNQQIGYCDQSFTCNQKYQEASKTYDRNVFIVLVVLGVITFVLSLMFMKIDILSISLSIGAVLDFVIASMRYWARADDLIKVLILGVALAVLVWVAVKKFNIKSKDEVSS
jgi:hypothetical protein